MELIKTVFYFLIVIGVMVVIHEWGHFIAARMCGIRADIFSFGMGKRLFGWHRKSGFTFGELAEDYDYGGTTDWRVSLVPMGGYVKVAGMVDESFDTEFANKAPEPWEFRSKNAFQKALVLCAGVIMNFVLAIVIFAGMSLKNGEQIIKTNEIGYVKPGLAGEEFGFKSGDKVISINGHNITDFKEIIKYTAISELGQDKNIIVERNGKQENISLSGTKIINKLKNTNKEQTFGIFPNGYKVFISIVENNKPASLAGIKTGDTVLSINNIQLKSAFQISDIFSKLKNQPTTVQVKRGQSTLDIKVTPNDGGKIGVLPDEIFTGQHEKVSYNFFEAMGNGFTQTKDMVNLIIDSFTQIFKGKVKFNEAVAGPIMIAKQSSKSAEMGLEPFLRFMALISISLAVMNILPFPALDGGHLVFVIVESIIRREVPVKAKLYIQNIGFGILLLFFVYVIIIDLMRI